MRILVTRPSPDAERTAARLSAMGHEVLVAPLIVVESRAFTLPDRMFSGIIATSANAFRATAAAELPRAPMYAVGHHTAEAARDAGCADVRTAGGDALALLALIKAAQPPPASLLFLAGVDRKPTLEDELTGAGYELLVREAYAAVAVDALPAEVRSALAGETIDAVVHYSSRSAAIFIRLVVQSGFGVTIGAIAQHCLSLDCAQPLLAAGVRVVIAAEPTESALLATLPPR